MPGLLDLPSELLYDIIGHVADSPLPLPQGRRRYRPDEQYSRSIVCVPSTASAWLSPTHSLLLACKRLHSETITYHKKATARLLMDVAVVDNHWIWPCFRVLPIGVGDVLEDFHINLIYCCNEEERGAYSSRSPTYAYEPEFVRMISNVLSSGSSGLGLSSSSADFRSGFRVKTITVDVDVCKGRKDPLSQEEIPYRQIELLSHLRFDPLYPVDPIECSRHLAWLATTTERALSNASCGPVILERVDRIEFCLGGGSLQCTVIDVAALKAKKNEAVMAE